MSDSFETMSLMSDSFETMSLMSDSFKTMSLMSDSSENYATDARDAIMCARDDSKSRPWCI